VRAFSSSPRRQDRGSTRESRVASSRPRDFANRVSRRLVDWYCINNGTLGKELTGELPGTLTISQAAVGRRTGRRISFPARRAAGRARTQRRCLTRNPARSQERACPSPSRRSFPSDAKPRFGDVRRVVQDREARGARGSLERQRRPRVAGRASQAGQRGKVAATRGNQIRVIDTGTAHSAKRQISESRKDSAPSSRHDRFPPSSVHVLGETCSFSSASVFFTGSSRRAASRRPPPA
jgi:hypothetical protein